MANTAPAFIVDVLRFSPLLSVLVQGIRLLIKLRLLRDERIQNGESLLLFSFEIVIAESWRMYLYSVWKVLRGS